MKTALQENNSIHLPNPLAPVAPLLLHASRTFLSEAGASAIFLNKVNKNLHKKINIKKDVKVNYCNVLSRDNNKRF